MSAASEDVQPRVIGAPGTMLLGVGGYIDRFFTADHETTFVYTAQVDFGRFLSRHIVVGGGIAGTGSFGGNADTLTTGPGAPATHAFGGAHWYFTPQSLASVYAGAEYWAQIARRDGPDAGAVLAKVGLQGALSSRASVYLEGGYGLGLTRNDEGFPTRVVGRFGFRIKL